MKYTWCHLITDIQFYYDSITAVLLFFCNSSPISTICELGLYNDAPCLNWSNICDLHIYMRCLEIDNFSLYQKYNWPLPIRNSHVCARASKWTSTYIYTYIYIYYICPSVRPSSRRPNIIMSVSFTILVESISNLCILSANFGRCVACQFLFLSKFQNLEFFQMFYLMT